MMKHTLLLAVAFTAFLTGCGTSDGTSADADTIARDEFDTHTMLQNLVDNVFIPAYNNVDTALLQTQTAIADYCAAIGSDDEHSNLAAAQQAWRDSISAWQFTEAFIVGPAANNSNSLRNRIYSFGAQTTSSCAIDQSVVQNQTNTFDITVRPNGSRGLDALEYLLFNDDLSHSCPALITETANWDTLPEASRKIQRCRYAATAIDDIVTANQSIVNSWTNDNFRSVFLNPLNTATSLAQVSDGLFFIDTDVKDLRLGNPLGRNKCAPVDCTARTRVESPYANHSYANIHANLAGFNAVFFGEQGVSFDDLIRSVGQAELNQRFSDQLAAALATIAARDSSLADDARNVLGDQAIAECELAIGAPEQQGNQPICNVYGAVKALSDSLKTEFILATALEIPDRAQSDND